jgi:glycosyltransferase involved in cell wall biosynthesis
MILHTVASLNESEGGVPRSTLALARHLSEGRLSVAVVQVEDNGGGQQAAWAEPRHGLRVHTGLGSRYKLHDAGRLLNALYGGSRIDLVHDHGIWLPMHHGIAAWCRQTGVPRMVSVRGMLNPWAVGHHAARKRFAWLAFQRRDLATADVLHATSDAELSAIRAAGMRQPVVLLPNGIEPPAEVTAPLSAGPRTALFLSRLHPSKGIDLLLQAWRDAAPRGWRLLIAGAGAAAFVRSIERAIAALGLRDTVSLCGPADDAAKWRLYAQAELFLLPTRSENFGLVVAEALAAGVPVITTHAAPWEWLPAKQAGWWVPADAASLASGIRAATALSSAELRAMGRRGRGEALDRFDWPAIAAQFLATYDWILGRGPAPPCLHL